LKDLRDMRGKRIVVSERAVVRNLGGGYGVVLVDDRYDALFDQGFERIGIFSLVIGSARSSFVRRIWATTRLYPRNSGCKRS
jgi:hypothetical protein